MGFCQKFIYSFLFSFWLLVKEFLVTMKIYCSEVFQKYKSHSRTFRKCYRDLALTGIVQSLIVPVSPAMMTWCVGGRRQQTTVCTSVRSAQRRSSARLSTCTSQVRRLRSIHRDFKSWWVIRYKTVAGCSQGRWVTIFLLVSSYM